MSEIENISIVIVKRLKYLSQQKRINYHEAEQYFTHDFHYISKDQNISSNTIYHFLENLNSNECRYEVQKIKILSKNIYLIHLNCINNRIEKIYHNTILIHGVSTLIIKRIENRYLISDAIEFNNEQSSPVYSVLKNFS
ncbi:hypothetical protein F887_02358 [Acinetobacter sp. NIPH 2100]|nr:hypothetical protein F887_02358 [Acinetobacter sp. NIPH 2100]